MGMRNKVAAMEEERKRKEKDLRIIIAERQEELERWELRVCPDPPRDNGLLKTAVLWSAG